MNQPPLQIDPFDQPQSHSAQWLEAIPEGDPQQVRELSPAILGTYQVIDGHSELAGCTLDPRPFLRLSLAADADAAAVCHRWFGCDGQPVEASLFERLHLSHIVSCDPRLRRNDAPMVRQWIETSLASLQDSSALLEQHDPFGSNSSPELLAATITWCRWAEGTVAFRFRNGASARTSFEGWAADFVNGNQRPEPFACEESGAAGYKVMALDDQTVTVPQAVARCEVTGQTTLAVRLVGCAVTGKKVLPEQLVACPITHRKVLPDVLQTCRWCDRQVLPEQWSDAICADCRDGSPIAADDSVLKELLAKHPQWKSFHRWKGWRDADSAVLFASRLRGEIAIVWDCAEHRIRKLAKRGRFRREWQIID